MTKKIVMESIASTARIPTMKKVMKKMVENSIVTLTVENIRAKTVAVAASKLR